VNQQVRIEDDGIHLMTLAEIWHTAKKRVTRSIFISPVNRNTKDAQVELVEENIDNVSGRDNR
jgi:hypothetical protein